MTRPRILRTVRIVALVLGGALFLLLTVRGSLASLHRAHGSSDAPTIADGKMFLVNRIAYDIRLPFLGIPVARRTDPRRGDVVLFAMPGSGSLATKRVVGVAGDVVEVRAGRLVLNGVPATYRPAGSIAFSNVLIEEWGDQSHFVIVTATASPIDATTVPADHFYLLGDNRERSLDSREFGPVPRSAIHGRVILGKLAPPRPR